MIYVQFYQRSAIDPLVTIEACGDRSVVILDGRCSNERNGRIAEHECSKRGYIAWRIFRGETFTHSAAISQLNFVHSNAPVKNPLWLSAHN
jgi:hypothetical protein